MALALTGGLAPVRAQDSLFTLPPTAATVRGRVVIPSAARERPVAGVMVTVHRVGADSAGPQDSVRTDAAGHYTLRYRRFGSDRAVYFAAAVYRGIAYFTEPLHPGLTAGDDGVISVFDTTSHPVPLGIQGHHLVVGAPAPDGTRTLVEVFELSNDTLVTIVGRDSLTPVWSTVLPRGAAGFTAGPGDVSGDALAVRDGRVAMLAPFGPGVKQLSYSYTLEADAFPLRLGLERQTGVLEVLLEEDGAQVRGASLHSEGNVTTQGRHFKRFLSPGAPAGTEIRVDVPTVTSTLRIRVLAVLAAVIVLAMGGALVRALLAGRPARRAAPAAPAGTESLVAALAVLDARHEACDPSLSDEEYRERRHALKRELSAVLEPEGQG